MYIHILFIYIYIYKYTCLVTTHKRTKRSTSITNLEAKVIVFASRQVVLLLIDTITEMKKHIPIQKFPYNACYMKIIY